MSLLINLKDILIKSDLQKQDCVVVANYKLSARGIPYYVFIY